MSSPTPPAPGEPPDAAAAPAAAPEAADAARSFPDRRRIERGAWLAFVLGTLVITACLGLRTAVFGPDYSLEGAELGALAVHGTAEIVVAMVVGAIALWPRRAGVGKGMLAGLAVLAILAKGVFLAMFLAIAEPPESSMSPGTLLICWLVTVPLWLSFFPVLTTIGVARQGKALDAPLDVRAAVGAWIGMLGVIALVLGPDVAVRFWGVIALGGAALWASRGAAEERRLQAWLRDAVGRGAPVYEVQEGAVADEIPSVYASDPRRAAIAVAQQDSASYRRDPSRRPIAAFDPQASLEPRGFGARIQLRASVSLVIALLASALCWPFLHGSDLPPRRLVQQYDHARLERITDFEVEGLTLWKVSYTPESSFVTGFAPGSNTVVEGEALFRRARHMPVGDLASFANSVYFRGPCCVVGARDRLDPEAPGGPAPTPPFVDGGKLVFWRRHEGNLERLEVAIEPEMVSLKSDGGAE